MQSRLPPRLCLLLLAGFTFPACAHETRPGYLQITEGRDHSYQVLWKQPILGNATLRLRPHLSGGWLDSDPAQRYVAGSSRVMIWKSSPSGHPLDGQRLSIEGLERTMTDVLVVATRIDGKRLQHVLKPNNASMVLQFEKTGTSVASYLTLGVEHILTGFDHLAFVLGLMLLIRERRQLVATITAFTVAHSITLAAAALELIRVNSAVVESIVALSILLVAMEAAHVHEGRVGITATSPWRIAFAFGLLHGLAFAGALADIGLPHNAVIPSLVLFNLGVELGQLAFVAAVLLAVHLFSKLPFRGRPSAWMNRVPAYFIGTAAIHWLIARLTVVIA